MVVTYVVTTAVPDRRQGAQGIQAGLTVEVHRSCEMGDKSTSFLITTVGGVGAAITSIIAWISADIAEVTTDKAIRTANTAIKTAFDIAIASVTLEFTI